eukprot:c11513_g1_i1.p1 GENE.c11513_g1_i1~~c11513_g1_i1.p1  ORF type:complete len:803 (-),score=207.93 c11513_g1_i1:329-2737(-)
MNNVFTADDDSDVDSTSFARAQHAGSAPKLDDPRLVDEDPLDAPDFDPVAYINKTFPNESALEGIDIFISKVRSKIRTLDESIVMAIREQSKSGSKAKQDIQDAEKAIHELFNKLKDIKTKAEQSEAMVQEICRDIKALDYGKRNLTVTITTLKRLHMLVTAVDQLTAMAKSRQYREAANLLEATKQLSTHFEAYRKIQKISELQDQIKSIEAELKQQVFSDFQKDINAPVDQHQVPLADACKLIDALGIEARRELMMWYSGTQFAAYKNAFQPYGESGTIDKTEKRFAWMRRLLRQYDEEHSNIFPSHWLVDESLCAEFVEITAHHMTEILQKHRENMDVTVFMHVLQKTVEFEKELHQRFASASPDGRTPDPKDKDQFAGDADIGVADLNSVEGIKAKYRIMKQQRQADEQPTRGPQHDDHVHSRRKWNGISQSFEPFMDLYVSLEDKNMQDMLKKLVTEETWQVPEGGSQPKVLQSSTDLFLYIKRVLRRCSSYTRGKKLTDLHNVFLKNLTEYSNCLLSHLPAFSQTPAPLSEVEEWVTCYIVNTAEYCYETCQGLCDSVKRLVAPELVESISVEPVQDAFHNVSTHAVKILVNHVTGHLEPALGRMTRMNWAGMVEVGDSSEFITEMGQELAKVMPTITNTLTSSFLRFFCDKFVTSFMQRYLANIYKCRRINETGAQQLLLDTQTLQSILFQLPIMGLMTQSTGTGTGTSNTASASFKAFVEREMEKVERIIKVLANPTELALPTFSELLKDGSAYDFQKILELKGLKKPEVAQLVAKLTAERSASRDTKTRTGLL